jgi:glycerophosphoryl diester phosphodiesterase
MWGYFRIFPDSALLLAFALLTGWALRKYQARRKAAGKRASALPVILVLAAYAGIWCLALVFPPGSVYSGQLPEKPRLIAHRGASMLAPENTLAAAQAAADLHAYGLETDIHVGRDGSLFLVHDDTFDRTTDIRQVYPGREKEPVEDFSLEEVNQLNAGRWFVEQDPFQAVRRKAVSSQQVEADQGQGIPTLSEELAFVRQSKQVFIFDLKPPPAGHPYASSFFDLALEQIHQAGIDPQVWFLVDERQLPVLRRVAPQMTPAFGANYQALPEAQELKALGYRLVNVEYGIPPGKIRAYQEAGLWVNVYTVDEPWQFSRLWLYGVASITTSNVAAMANLKDPMLSMPYPWFLGIWSVVGLLGVGGIFWTANFELRIWRERLTV